MAFVGVGFGVARKARGSQCGRRMVMMRSWVVEADGKVSMPSPFGVVTRDLQELNPRVLMAAEMREPNEERLEELKKVLLDPDATCPQMLNAVSEMRFFPQESVIPTMVECLRSTPDELTRSHIVWTLALFRDGDDECWQTILSELDDLTNPTVSAAAAGALGHLGDPEAISPLVRAFTMSSDFIVQMSAIVALGTIGDSSILPQLVTWLREYNPDELNSDSLLVQAIIGAIGDVGRVEGLDVLLRWADNPEALVRHQVAEALMGLRVKEQRVEDALAKLAKDKERVVSFTAEKLLDTYRNTS